MIRNLGEKSEEKIEGTNLRNTEIMLTKVVKLDSFD